MPSSRMISIISLLASTTLAAKVPTARVTNIADASPTALEDNAATTTGMSGVSIGNCPNGWLDSTYNSDSYCCPGAVYSNKDGSNNVDDAFCCVGADFAVQTASFASCFPLCSGSQGVTQISTTQQSCSSSIPLTASDYSSRVNQAARAVATITGSLTGASGGSGGNGGSTAGASTGSSSAGAAMVTSGPLAGAVMVAGGLLMAM